MPPHTPPASLPAALAAALLLATQHPASAQASLAQPRQEGTPLPTGNVLACRGVFAAGQTHADIVKAFGRRDVTTETVDGAEGESSSVTVIHAKDPARRIEVSWSDARRARLSGVEVREGSAWRIAGVGMGMSVADVEAANGRPFELSGFYWDYGGFATDWKGGALASLPGGCTLTVRFGPPEGLPDSVTEPVSGERTLSSHSPAVRAAKPVVQVLSFGYPDK